MQTGPSALNRDFRYEDETVIGQVKPRPTFKPIPINGVTPASDNISIERYDAKDRGQRSSISVPRIAVTGALNGVMVTGGLDPFIESSHQSLFREIAKPTGYLINGAVAKDQTAWMVDGGTELLPPGTVINVASNTVDYTVVESTLTRIEVSPGASAALNDNSAITVKTTPEDLVNAEQIITKTLENRLPEGEGSSNIIHERYLGCKFNNMNLNQQPNADMAASFGFIGMDRDRVTTAVPNATYPASSTFPNETVTAGDEIGLVAVRGYESGNTLITEDFVMPPIRSFILNHAIVGDEGQPVANRTALNGIVPGAFRPVITLEFYPSMGAATLEAASIRNSNAGADDDREKVSVTIGPFRGYQFHYPKCEVGAITKTYPDTGSITWSIQLFPTRETDGAKIDPYHAQAMRILGSVRITRGMGDVANILPPIVSEFTTFSAAKTTSTFVASDFSDDNSSQTDNIALPDFTANRYVAIARDTRLPDIVSIRQSGGIFNEIGAFTKQSGTVTIGGQTYNVWRSNGQFFPALSEKVFVIM